MDVNLGALAPPLGEQIKSLPNKEAERLDLHRHAINQLRIDGILTKTESIRAEQRLLREIASILRQDAP